MPGESARNRNTPSASVGWLCDPVRPVIVTVTPGRTAPCASATVPAIVPVNVCAAASDGTEARSRTSKNARRLVIAVALQRPDDRMRSFEEEYNAYATPAPNAASTATPAGVLKNDPDSRFWLEPVWSAVPLAARAAGGPVFVSRSVSMAAMRATDARMLGVSIRARSVANAVAGKLTLTANALAIASMRRPRSFDLLISHPPH